MTQKVTVRLPISPDDVEGEAARRVLGEAAQVLHSGGLVAFPTETVYGLGANALNGEAVAGIFRAKQRPAWDPLIVHVANFAMLDRVVAEVSPRARNLMDAFWPGPLTFLLRRRDTVPDAVTAGRPLVAVRMPVHPVAHALIALADLPVAAPSANRFSRPSATTAQHVLEDLDGRIDLVLDGGATGWGLESTVIEVTESSIRLYRPGAISAEAIEAIAGPVEVYHASAESEATPESLPSPGVGMRHYAPNARLVPVDVGAAPESEQQARWIEAVREQAGENQAVAVMLPTGWPLPENFRGRQYLWGQWSEDRELAHRLFTGLRTLDSLQVEKILCPLPAPVGLGAAIRDRLRKAARED